MSDRFQFVLPIDGDDEPKHVIAAGHGDETPGRVDVPKFKTYAEYLADAEKILVPTLPRDNIAPDELTTTVNVDKEIADEDPEFVAARRMVFAAARVIRDSHTLQDWNDYEDADRYTVAMNYVQAQSYMNAGKLNLDGANGDDFDNRFELVTSDDWDDFADVKADEMIEEAKSSGELVIPDNLDYYYDFDYETWRRDLKQDYQVIELHENKASLGVLLILRST